MFFWARREAAMGVGEALCLPDFSSHVQELIILHEALKAPSYWSTGFFLQ